MPTHSYGYSDLPAREDELGFAPAVDALARVVQQAELTDTPLTVGIYGPWGSGKTSLMQMILAELDHNRCVPVWFDAWRYAQSDALWRALLLAVVEALRLFVARDDDWLRAYIDHRNRRPSPDQQSGTDAAALAATRAELNQRLDNLVNSLYRSVEREEPGELRFQ